MATTPSAKATSGLPRDIASDRPTSHEAPWPLHATPGRQGDLWFVSRQGLFHSTNAGEVFTRVDGGARGVAISFGKSPGGRDYPTLFALGIQLKAIWRSDDASGSWLPVNDDRHQWGTRVRCITGDLRIFGRVYVGTDDRGIFYGEPVVK